MTAPAVVLAVALAAAACGAAVTVRRPVFGIAALVVLVPFDWGQRLGPTQITLAKSVLVGVLAGLALRRASLAPLWAPAARPLVGGLLALVVVNAVSALPALYIDTVVRETLKSIQYALAFAAAALAVYAEGESDEIFWWSVLLVTGGACTFALAQTITGAPSAMLVGTQTVPRISGPLEGPNQFAGFLDLVLPLLLLRALATGTRFRPVAVAALGLALVADVLTFSRAGIFGAVVGIGIVLAFRLRVASARIPFAFAALALAVLLGGALARPGIAARFVSPAEIERNDGLGTRAELWTAAVRLWMTDPALGIGAGNFEYRLPEAGLVGIRTHANNLYLQSLAEGGLALLAATVWTLVAGATLCLRRARQSPLLLGIGAATVGFAAHQLFDVLSFYPKVGMFWALLLGVAAARATRLERPETGAG